MTKRPPTRSFAVRVAYEWHGGQASALYSFASCGGVVHHLAHLQGLIREIQGSIVWCNHHNEALAEHGRKDEYEKEPYRLQRLLEFIQAQPLAST